LSWPASGRAGAANDDLDAAFDAAGRHDWPNAITYLTRAIDSGKLSRHQTLQALEARSGTRIAMGQLDLALADCNLALSIDPDHGPTLINRAIVRIATRHANLALADLNKAIDRGKLSRVGLFTAYFNRGWAWYEIHDLPRAAKDFDAAIAFNPTSASAFSFRGTIRLEREDYDGAIEDFDKVTYLTPDFSRPFVGRGAIYLARGQLDMSLAELDHAIELSATDPDAFFYRGQIRFLQRNFETAIEDFDRAVELQPFYPKASKFRGLAKFNLGRYGEAAGDFKLSQAGAESNDDTAIWLYMALGRTGDRKSAEFELKRRLSWTSAGSGNWPQPLLRYFGARASEQDVLQAAGLGDERQRALRACDVDFYLAEWALLRNDKQEAASLFRLALSSCADLSREHVTAQTEINNLPN
jgi:lipoprotein NlpI